MTLALHGKSRQRQWLLVVVGIMAVLGAAMVAVTARGSAEAVDPPSAVPLNGAHVGATNPGFDVGTCPTPPAGKEGWYGWHFLMPANNNFTSLSVTFQSAGTFSADPFPGGVFVASPDSSHAYIWTPTADTLLSGTATSDGENNFFNLSHICPGTPPTEPEDPTLTKVYNGPSDGQSFSWTIEITNPNAQAIEAYLLDEEAYLDSTDPSGQCTGIFEEFTCNVAANSTLKVYLYTPVPDGFDFCDPKYENFAQLMVSFDVDRTPDNIIDSAFAEVDDEPLPDCNRVPIQICKVFLDNQDGTSTGATEFFFEMNGDPLDSLTVAEDDEDCFYVWVTPGEANTFAEVAGSIVDADGFPKVGFGSFFGDAIEGDSLSVTVIEFDETFICGTTVVLEVLDQRIEAQENGAIDAVCTITFWNQEEPGEVLEEGIITVIKYLDINGDGDANDPGEGPIQGWSITVDGVVSQTNASGETGANVTVGDLVPVSEATPAGYKVIGARVNFGALLAGASGLNVNITGAVTVVEFFNQPLGAINVHKDTFSRHNDGPWVPRPNDDDGWTITVTSVACGINISKQTDANGNAVFEDLPLCSDYVVSENPVNPSSPGFTPQGPTSVNNVTPGGQTITFTNAILTFDPPCTNINQCGPVTLITPTPTPTNPPVVTPTNTPVPPTATPEEAIEGESTPGPGGQATPIAPSTGSGTGGTMTAGMNMLLVIAGLLALGSGLTVATAARRRR